MATISIKDGQFVDEHDRIVVLRGINFSADSKAPLHDPRRYIDTPCPLNEADEHYERLRGLGFNCLRWIYTWDALQPLGPDEIDEAYIDYVIEMVRKALSHGFYVFMDCHQDIWSRFCGGSGAPEWTLHAAGLDPRYFNETHASMIWSPDEHQPIKMLWASNYHRLACLTMFTLFFAGNEFAPKAQINGQNVGSYLESKYFAALRRFMERVNEADLGPKMLGWESLNEPGHGMIGWDHLDEHPSAHHHVKLGTAPTPFQAMLLGHGIPLTVESFTFTPVGLKGIGDSTIQPSRGTWLTPEDLAEVDAKHDWKRSWPGGCIWELHGIYSAFDRTLLKPSYFTMIDDKKVGERVFVEQFFIRHWQTFVDMVESVNPDWFRLMQAPVNLPPPDMSHRPVDVTRTVYTPHYYDGMTLLLKRWRWLNVDAIGVMRDLYSSPIPALRFGTKHIKRSFSSQLRYLKDEGAERLGVKVPMILSEIGIPFDLDGKRAFKNGYWYDHVRAIDANSYAIEDNSLSHCWWCYCITNTHYSGDNFAGEDLSIWSRDDMDPELGPDKPENGVRAPAGVIRPTPTAVAGEIITYYFDVYKAVFTLQIRAPKKGTTEVYLPLFHFPGFETDVKVSIGGDWDRRGQILQWEHLEGIQTLTVRGVSRFGDTLYSYIDPVQKLLGVVKSGVWMGKSNRQ